MKDFDNSLSEGNFCENELSKPRNISDKDINNTDDGAKKLSESLLTKLTHENKYLKFFNNIKQSGSIKNKDNKKLYTYSRLPFSLSQSDLDAKDLNVHNEKKSSTNANESNSKMENFQCDHIKKQKCKDGIFSCSDNVNMSEGDYQKCVTHLKLERKESLGVDKDFYGHYGFTNTPRAVNLGSCDVKDCDKRYRSAKVADNQLKPDNTDSRK